MSHHRDGGDEGLVHLGNVTLTGEAHSAMIWAACHTGERQIDVINRALIAYAHMMELGPGDTASLELTDPPTHGGQLRRLVIWRRRNRRGK